MAGLSCCTESREAAANMSSFFFSNWSIRQIVGGYGTSLPTLFASLWVHFGLQIQEQLLWPGKRKSRNSGAEIRKRKFATAVPKPTKCAIICRFQPTGFQGSVWRGHMVLPNEQVLDVSISILLQVSPSYSQAPPSPAPIGNSPHVVAPLCKRKSPWINECVSCCFSQSLVHCGKLINQAEVLQIDLSKREVIVQTPAVFLSFLS